MDVNSLAHTLWLILRICTFSFFEFENSGILCENDVPKIDNSSWIHPTNSY
jgi:hypothetical protein